MNFRIFLLILGFFWLLVGLFNWHWYFYHPLVRFYSNFDNSIEARIFHSVMGLILIGLGVILR